jgi:hypothetical protein
MKTRIAIFTALLASMTLLDGAVLTFVNTTDQGHTFVYSGFVQNNQQVSTGDSLIVLDFAGLVSGEGPSSDWKFSSVTDTAGQPDDPAITDAVFTYTGAPIQGLPGNTQLGTFSLTTTLLSQTQGRYIYTTTRTNGSNAGEEFVHSGTVPVPTTAGVPEPVSACLVGAGLVAVSCGRRKSRKGSI